MECEYQRLIVQGPDEGEPIGRDRHSDPCFQMKACEIEKKSQLWTAGAGFNGLEI